MLRLGVRTLDNYQPGPAPRWTPNLRALLSRNRIAYSLLRTSLPPSDREISLFDEVMQRMQLASGVFRFTARRRFANLDPQVAKVLTAHFSPSQPLAVHDWAASSCLTSSEWAGSLLATFPQASLIASDLTLFLLEATLPDGNTFIFEPGGNLLQYLQGPFVVFLVPEEPSFLLWNRHLAQRAKARFSTLFPIWKLPADWLAEDCLSPARPAFHLPTASFRRIPLIHPEAAALALRDLRFHIQRHSAFEPTPAPVHIIRTMNIFNNSYFPPDQLSLGISAVWRSLLPAGLWIVGRTISEDPPVHHASLFQKTPDGFSPLSHIGPGSEIAPLVQQFRPQS